MSYEITGKVVHLEKTVDVSDRFRKREFVISKTDTNPNTNTSYTNEIKFQAVQNNCGLLDKISIGDTVDIKFNIKGTKWKETWFNNLDVYSVELNDSDDSDELSANEVFLGVSKTPKKETKSSSTSKRVVPTQSKEDDFFSDDDDLPF
jgi:hypothetical protein